MSNRPRIIERSEDDLVVPWRWTGQISAAAVFLVLVVLIGLRWMA